MSDTWSKTPHRSMSAESSSSGAQHHALVAEFLTALGQALASMSLYGAGHPSRGISRTRAHERLAAALAIVHPLRLTFLDGDIIVGLQALHELRAGDLAQRLGAAGVQRLEFDGAVPTDAVMTALLDTLYAAAGPHGTPVTQMVALPGIRLGPVALLSDASEDNSPTGASGVGRQENEESAFMNALVTAGLQEELDTMTWIASSTAARGRVPIGDVEAVIRGLSLSMQAEHDTLIPLISLKSVDEYTTVHACNVSMLAMGLAESLGFASRDVRAVGTAALLHDIGKVKLPESILRKAGALTDSERALMCTHPVEGAKLLGARGEGHALAAIVAYEHHVWANGEGGYPTFQFPRRTHYVSRLVQVCDVYDALSTERPYRAAWPRARTLHYMRLQAGRELDYDLLLAFFDLLDRAERRQAAG
ncbi:HD-GYP domain-containing protein [Gemmatimonas sp.]|jgi:putative nucleotidyltransferase with HDIG domain|uniref:HD-GYP domain-containing protein n=1 Tax=Gemmatimonas sp. TaxID=1962908 RepID=UPI0031C95EB9|nr:HD domain-containing protein [Gemmatimonas sp.]